jgi:polar amino acid transport system substrate-binding protein
MMKKRTLVVFYLLLGLVVLHAEKPDEREIIIGTVGMEFPPSLVARDILTEAYAKIGYSPEFVVYPALRMIALMDSGDVDAIIIADESFSADHPNSIRVDTSIWNDRLVAFTKEGITINGWEDLRPYRVGYLPGMRIVEKRLAEGYTRLPVQDPASLIQMLELGRIDVFVTSFSIGALTLNQQRVTDISCMQDNLAIVPNYHYLSTKNAALAKRLSATLAQMDKSGRISGITQSTLKRLFPNGDDWRRFYVENAKEP